MNDEPNYNTDEWGDPVFTDYFGDTITLTLHNSGYVSFFVQDTEVYLNPEQAAQFADILTAHVNDDNDDNGAP